VIFHEVQRRGKWRRNSSTAVHVHRRDGGRTASRHDRQRPELSSDSPRRRNHPGPRPDRTHKGAAAFLTMLQGPSAAVEGGPAHGPHKTADQLKKEKGLATFDAGPRFSGPQRLNRMRTRISRASMTPTRYQWRVSNDRERSPSPVLDTPRWCCAGQMVPRSRDSLRCGARRESSASPAKR